MRALYIDPFSGISGNMYIGALLDMGAEIGPFLEGIAPLGVTAEDILLKKVDRKGIRATYFNLKGEEEKLRAHEHEHEHAHHHEHEHGHTHNHTHGGHRTLADVMDCIDKSAFDDEVKILAKAIYMPLARAEAAIHGKCLADVHFHEVGETDAIVDVLGAAYFTFAWDVEEIYVGKINAGFGTVHCAHGNYPLPAPATAKILADLNAPLGGMPVETELTTPTGAAILKGIGAQYRPMPEGRILKSAYGAGTKDGAWANVLRVLLLETEEAEAPIWYSCNIDDMTGEELGFCMEKLFEAGAKDVTFTPIYMKKNRPGQRIDVLGARADAEALKEILFTHTTTLGIKEIPLEKIELARTVESGTIGTRAVRTKTARYGDRKKASPEYEDLRALATEEDISLRAAYGLWERRR